MASSSDRMLQRNAHPDSSNASGNAPTVIVLGSDSQGIVDDPSLREICHVQPASSIEHAIALLRQGNVASLVVLPPFSPDEAHRLIARVLDESDGFVPAFIVLVGQGRNTLFQDLVNNDQLFYLAAEPFAAPDVALLVARSIEPSLERERVARSSRANPIELESNDLDRIRQTAESSRDVPAAEGLSLCTATASELVDAERTYCLLYIADNQTLWRPHGGVDGREDSVVTGLAGYVSRARAGVIVPDTGADPRFDVEVDDPLGAGGALIAVPVLGESGELFAVLVALRDNATRCFSERDLAILAESGSQWAASFDRWRSELPHRLPFDIRNLFLAEALAHREGGLLNRAERPVEPRWIRNTCALLLAVMGAAAICATLIEVKEEIAATAVVAGGESMGNIDTSSKGGEGEHAAASETLVDHPTVVALVPAARRSRLRPGVPMRVSLSDIETDLIVDIGRVDNDPMTRKDARDLFGLSGSAENEADSVVLVRSRLQPQALRASGLTAARLLGMTGTARIEQSQSLASYLIPGR